MKRPGHPSMRKLQRWIDDGDETVDRHLATCAHCSSRIETLLGEPETNIGVALAELLAMPDEVPERLQKNIDARLNNRKDLTLLGELFGLPFRTARVMSTTQGEK